MGKLFFVFVIVCVVLVCIGDWEWWVFMNWFIGLEWYRCFVSYPFV